MQIVIDIPEEIYCRIMAQKDYAYDVMRTIEAVERGVVLPKGHGRLINADAIESLLRNKGFDKARSPKFYEIIWALKQVHNAPTIIESDKEAAKDADSD